MYLNKKNRSYRIPDGYRIPVKYNPSGRVPDKSDPMPITNFLLIFQDFFVNISQIVGQNGFKPTFSC
jgi:hypothetical protein